MSSDAQQETSSCPTGRSADDLKAGWPHRLLAAVCGTTRQRATPYHEKAIGGEVLEDGDGASWSVRGSRPSAGTLALYVQRPGNSGYRAQLLRMPRSNRPRKSRARSNSEM